MAKKPSRPKTPIHPTVFLVLGLAISIYALFIKFTVKESNQEIMGVFAIIGGFFFFIGLIKLILLIKRDHKPASSDEEEIANQFTNIKVQPPVGEKTVILCSKCRSRNYSTSNFCHMCGGRLR